MSTHDPRGTLGKAILAALLGSLRGTESKFNINAPDPEEVRRLFARRIPVKNVMRVTPEGVEPPGPFRSAPRRGFSDDFSEDKDDTPASDIASAFQSIALRQDKLIRTLVFHLHFHRRGERRAVAFIEYLRSVKNPAVIEALVHAESFANDECSTPDPVEAGALYGGLTKDQVDDILKERNQTKQGYRNSHFDRLHEGSLPDDDLANRWLSAFSNSLDSDNDQRTAKDRVLAAMVAAGNAPNPDDQVNTDEMVQLMSDLGMDQVETGPGAKAAVDPKKETLL